MTDVNSILRQAISIPTQEQDQAFVDTGANPYATPGYVAPEEDPADEGMVYNGPAAAPWVAPAIPSPAQKKMSTLDTTSTAKRENVMARATEKQQLLSPQQHLQNAVGMNQRNSGYSSANQVERDLRDLTPTEIHQKYGDDAPDLLSGAAQGMRDELTANTRGARSPAELGGDFLLGLGQAIGNTVGGAAAVPVALASERLGTGAAGLLDEFNTYIDSKKSDKLNARNIPFEAKNALDNRDNVADEKATRLRNAEQKAVDMAAGMDESKATTRESIRNSSATLTRVLSDVGNSLVNATDDSATLGAGITNALGSFLAAGKVAQVLGKVTGGAAGMTSSIALTESGGSYTQLTNEVMKRSHEELMKSPDYAGLIEAGVPRDEAKRTVANREGLLAAAFTAPAAAAAGRLVHKFEGNVAALGSGKQLAQNILRETTEETIQSGSGQFAQNLADKLVGDPEKDLADGVGRQAAEGGLYGMGMTTALGIPSIAKSGAVGTGRVIAKAFNDRVAGIEEANEQASPVSDETVAKAAAEQAESAPAAAEVLRTAVAESNATPEQKVAASTYVDDLMAASNYDAVEAPPSMAQYMEGITSRPEAIKRVAEIVLGAEEGSPEQLRAGFYLNNLFQDYNAVVFGDQDAHAALEPGSQAAEIVDQYKSLAGAIGSSPAIVKAVDTVMAMIDARDAQKVEVTPETLATPEGQQEVQDVLATAELAPEKVDLETAENILYQIEQGNLSVTPRQKAAMDSSVALLRAVQEADKAAVAAGNADRVSLNISSIDGEKGYSVTQHAKGIMSAWKSGDRDLAASRLADLKDFAKGQSSKVGALNTHFAAGNPKGNGLGYEIFAEGKAAPSQKKVAARVHTEKGVKLAQQIAAEAKLLADVYNGLATAFPDLKAEHLAVTPLADGMVGPVADVIARTKAAKTAPSVKADVTSAPAQSAKQVADSLRAAEETKDRVALKAEVADKAEKEAARNKGKTPAQVASESAEALRTAIIVDTPAPKVAEPVVQEEPSVVNVWAGTNENASLSNLTDRAFEFDGRNYQSVEHAYQSNKSGSFDQATFDKYTGTSGKKIIGKMGTKTEGNYNLGLMQDLITESFEQNPAAAAELLATGDKQITHTQDRGIWAEKFPTMLMATRDLLNNPVEKEAAPVLKGTAAVFPDLVGGENNLFNRGYVLPKDQKTRTLGTDSPITTVRDALGSATTLSALLGSKMKGDFNSAVAEAYERYLGTAEDFVDELDDNLQSYLDRPYKKGAGVTRRDLIMSDKTVPKADGSPFSGAEYLDTDNGRALNIAEQDGDTLSYNSELIQGAVLAGLQWFIESPQIGGVQDKADIATLLGMTEATVDDSIVLALNEGLSRTEAIRSLAQKIRNYWGVQANRDEGRGVSEGIAEGIAAELLRVFTKNGWLTETTVKLTEADGLPALDSGKPNVKTFVQMVPVVKEGTPLHRDFGLTEFPSAIEQAVLLEPEDTHYIGEDVMPPVSDSQLRNASVKLTPEQKEAATNESETPYYINTVQAALYTAMGRDNFVKMFGAGELDPTKMNVNDLASKEGLNRSVVAAYEHFGNFLNRVANVGPLDSTPTRFAFGVTRVGRLQQLGQHTPQANKAVREALLPTYSNLDMTSSNGRDYNRFMLGIAQAMGEKIHNMSHSRSRLAVEAKLNGPLAQVVDTLGQWANNHKVSDVLSPSQALDDAVVDSVIDAFKAAGYGLTPMAFHALVEYGRVKHMADRSNVRTAIYVEADGMTNGPINAMMLFTTGLFTAKWITNMAKGGLFINRPGETANTYREFSDSTDLYQATTTSMMNGMERLRKDLATQDSGGTEQMNAMLHLMDEFFGGDLSFSQDAEGNTVLEMKRGIAKNPLTITIYGSGAGGIAAKMTKLLTDALYERMSQTAEARANGETSIALAMFGKQSASVEDAEARFAKFVDAYQKLTNTYTGAKIDGTFYFKKATVNSRATLRDPNKFTLELDQITNMQSTIRHLFVTPMREAISYTVGQELLDTAELLRQATQAQSIVLEHAFKAEVEAALAEKAKDPKWKKSFFLSPNEELAIHKKLAHLSPLVQTAGQSFYIAGTESADVDMAHFARSLEGDIRAPAFARGPKDAGVSGIPFMNIGTGDGLMMQLMSTMKNAVTGTLKIFDGVNIPLDQLEVGAEQANKAVFETWTQNPLAAVHATYSKFMSDAKLTGLSKEANLALSKALFGLQSEAVPETALIAAMTMLEGRLNKAQQEIEARHRVVNRVSVSIDQMAAVGVPFAKTGDLPLYGTDPVSIAEQLNIYRVAELAAIQKETPVKTTNSILDALATEHESGVRIMSSEALANLPSQLTAEQSAVLSTVVDSTAADGYRIVSGTMAQIGEFDGSTAPATAQGWINTGTKTIYLLNNSTETLLHELIHAASFEVIAAHYDGRSTRQVAAAIGRIEVMMHDFVASGIELTQTSDSVNSAFNNVSSTIAAYLAKGEQAKALNEFMAWTLSNESLVRMAQRQEVSKLARIKDNVISSIKSMLGIKESVGKDLFSNLLFNSAVIMQSQPTLAETFAENILFQNDIYGSNDRLTALNQAFNMAVGRYLETPVRAGNIDETAAFFTGIQNGYRVAQSFMAHGFNMTAQEASTFNSIVVALSTEAAIDPNAMAGVQQLYSHAMKQLTPESFMENPEAMDPNDYKQAAEKFDVLSGKYLVTKDLMGRSSLLPAFLALATTNDVFRNVLAEMSLPASAPNKEGTLDALLENTGEMLMGRLSTHMQGTKKAKNVQQAIDMLNARMAVVINERDTVIGTVAAKAGGMVDFTNDKVVEGMGWLAAKLLKFAKRSQHKAANRVERTASGIAAGFAALINEESAQAVSEGVMASVNKTAMWHPLATLIGDVVGRTKSNASVYDMIKVVRSIINRTRQQYRENLPKTLAKKFTRELTKEEGAAMHAWAKTDVATLGKDALTIDRAAAIKGLEAELSKNQNWNLIQTKAQQLAAFMNGAAPGKNLLRNPEAISKLLNENAKAGPVVDVAKLDRLITLYAMEGMSQEAKDAIATLSKDEADGMNFTLAYLRGQRVEEQRKATGRATLNYYKGYTPFIGNDSVSIIIADDSKYAELIGRSYERIGDYEGSSLEKGMRRGYYFIPVAARAQFEQGIMQNVQQTSGGVDQLTGFSLAQVAGRITAPADVKRMTQLQSRETGANPFMPIFDEQGAVVAYERSLDPAVMASTVGTQNLHKTLGQWRGRQVEEGFAQEFNDQLLGRLHDMYEADITKDVANEQQYIDVLSSKDPVIRDAARLINSQSRATAEGYFGKRLMVRKEMLDDVLGYRAASFGDSWTGVTRWSAETQKAVRNVAISVFGNAAYKNLMTAEKMIHNVVGDAKQLVVVKSVIVPMVNIMSNVYQLVSRGVPIGSMTKGIPAKLSETDGFVKSQIRLIEAEAELRAANGDPRAERKLKTEIQAIKDGQKRLSIWPLIEAGEFSGIADAGLTHSDIELTSGRLQAYMEQAAAKMPGWGATVGRYALVTKDTALYQALQKSVEYGDFLAKAVLFDHYTKKKGMTKAQALAEITEEFVNYDRLPGRFRGALEKLGLVWFYNFKIRSVKSAASVIRNNPVHNLFAMMAPTTDMFGTVGLPVQDNLLTKLFEGSLGNSIGPGQGLHSMMLNPWVNLTQ